MLRLLTVHNLHLYGALVREAREAIRAGRYAGLRAAPGSRGRLGRAPS